MKLQGFSKIVATFIVGVSLLVGSSWNFVNSNLYHCGGGTTSSTANYLNLFCKPTNTPVSPQPTNTPIPPQPTDTPVPPQPTDTPVSQQLTDTPVPPQPTDTPVSPQLTDTPIPSQLTDTPVHSQPTDTSTLVLLKTISPTNESQNQATKTPTFLPIPSATYTLKPILTTTLSISFTSTKAPTLSVNNSPSKVTPQATQLLSNLTLTPTSDLPLDVQIEILKEELTEKEKELKEKEDALKEAEEELEKNIQLAKDGDQKANAKIAELNETITNLEKTISDLKDEINTLSQKEVELLSRIIESKEQEQNRFLPWAIAESIGSVLAGLAGVFAIVVSIVSAIASIIKNRKEIMRFFRGHLNLAPPNIEIIVTNITTPIQAGGWAKLEIKVDPDTAVDGVVKYKSGTTRLDMIKADHDGKASWSWRVNKNIKPGIWSIELKCVDINGRTGSSTIAFEVR